jgi:hypothetical protein
MGAELTLRYSGAEELAEDFESNLRKGRAFVPGASALPQRGACTLHIERPDGGTLDLPAEAVWISEHPETGGVGLELVNFDADARDSLRAFVDMSEPPRTISGTRPRQLPPDASSNTQDAMDEGAPNSEAPVERNLHDQVRNLSLAERDALARIGNLPERVALERRYGGSVWEGLLQNPMLTTREVSRMAKSGNLPTTLLNLIVANAGWLSDTNIRGALLQNPRVSGMHLERVLRAATQADLRIIAEQTSLRTQVRTAAKRLIRR